jgi:hypothetical protein
MQGQQDMLEIKGITDAVLQEVPCNKGSWRCEISKMMASVELISSYLVALDHVR